MQIFQEKKMLRHAEGVKNDTSFYAVATLLRVN